MIMFADDVVDGKPVLKFVTPEAEDGNPVA
jgi:hypothetical protein